MIRLRHISAESFMGVIEQLARNDAAGRILRSIPVAMNQEANAIVIIGPPPAIDFFAAIVEGLDKPSEFHEQMRHREMEDKQRQMEMGAQMQQRQMQMRAEMQHRQMEMKAKMQHPGMPQPPHGDRPPHMQPPHGDRPPHMQPPQGDRPPHMQPPHGDRPPHMQPPQGMRPPHEGQPQPAQGGDRIGAAIGRLLSRPVAEKLGIDDDQHRRILEIGEETKGQMMHLRERVGRAMREAGPERRRELAKEAIPNARRRFAELAGQLRERIGEVLRPDQREKLREMRGARGGGAREMDRRHKDRPKEEARRPQMDRPPHEPREGRRPEKPRRPEEARPPRKEQGPEGPIGKLIGRLLSPPVIEKLGLKKEQILGIREMAEGVRREMGKLQEQARREIEGADPDRRAEIAGKVKGHVQERMRGLMKELHERVGHVLRPDQRERLEKILGRDEGRPKQEKPQPPKRKGKPGRPRRMKGRDKNRDESREKKERRDDRERDL